MCRPVAGLVVLAFALAVWVGPVSSASATVPRAIGVGTAIGVGHELRSADGRYTARMYASGDFIVHGPSGYVWSTGTRGRVARLLVRPNGDIAMIAAGRFSWHTGTAGSGSHNVLSLGTDGVLRLTNSAGLVWSSGFGNACTQNADARTVRVVLHRQLAWMCQRTQLVKTTYVTTGATASGDGTPTGSWRVYAKQRDTHLYPSAGGVYFVHYWMPYSGAYGMHDSPWQSFAYGSQRYRTDGSHGCIHFPGATMAWLYRWAAIGTRVTITS